MRGSHRLKWMNQPVAVGSASGVASTLILTLLRNLLQDTSLEVQPLQLRVDCPSFDINFEDIPWWTFGGGVLVGILLGPLVDCLSLLRQRWRRFIFSAFAQEHRRTTRRESSRPLHKVVA